MKSVLGDLALFASVMLALACGSLAGPLSGNAGFDMVSVFIGLVLGPLMVCGAFVTLNQGGKWKRALKIIGILVAGATIVLGNFRAEILLGEEAGKGIILISRVLFAFGIFLTGAISIVQGGGEENKEFWQKRDGPFGKCFTWTSVILIMPFASFALFEKISSQPAALSVLEDIFKQVAAYWLVIGFAVAGLAGATLLAVSVLVRLYYRPWFQTVQSGGETTSMSMPWVFLMAIRATVMVTVSHFVAQTAGMVLWVQQVGTGEYPLYWGLGFATAAVLVTSLVAKWRVNSYVLEP